MPTKRKIRLLVADDQEIVRAGLKALFAGTEIDVVAEAANSQAAVKLALEKAVDVVLLDVRMPDGDGLAALGRIRLDKPDLPVLLFSAFDNSASVARAIALGASGFLLKGCSRDELISAICGVAAGESIWSKEILRGASRSLRTPRHAGSLEAFLTEREGEVLRLIAHGMSNKEIAEALTVTYVTVTEHIQNIFRKLCVGDRTQAALWAVRNDLV